VPVAGRNDNFEPAGWLLGAQGGYNFVNDRNVLFGIEGDWSWLGTSDRAAGSETVLLGPPPVFGLDLRQEYNFQYVSQLDLNWQSTLRGRLGIIEGNTLIYGTAGVAFLDLDWSETATAEDVFANETYVQTHRGSETLVGVALGAGFEIAVSEDVFIGADYLYENFGPSGALPFGHSMPPQMGRLDDLDMHKFRHRLSFKFGNEP